MQRRSHLLRLLRLGSGRTAGLSKNLLKPGLPSARIWKNEIHEPMMRMTGLRSLESIHTYHSRYFSSSSMDGEETVSEICEADYNRECAKLFELLETELDVLDDLGEDSFELEYAQGVMTLQLRGKTWVLNKQAPNRQVWWSSPLSGPKRFYFHAESQEWRNTRDDQNLLELLKSEIKQVAGVDLELSVLFS